MGPTFEWDLAKEAENLLKHGVTFGEAQLAFADANLTIAKDLIHSDFEQRYFCFGRVARGILTVRFAYRGRIVRIIGAGYWRRGRKIYEARQIHQ